MNASNRKLLGSRYRLEQKLGRGGLGSVYRAYDVAQKRSVALKLLDRRQDATSQARAELRFRREFAVLASNRHPRIVEVFGYGVDSRGPFYTMELMEGQDLRHLENPTLEEAVRLLADVASALAFLHNRGLVHRDVAPRNVRCTHDGRAKLFDFGVVVDAGYAGDIAGTPGYVPPEAIHGMPLDARSDLFGFGVLAYFTLTRRLPYPARTFEEQLFAMRGAPPRLSSVRRDVPEALQDLIGECVRLDPLARPASAAEVIERLGAIVELPDAALEHEARGYLYTAALVGREHEVEQVRQYSRTAAQGLGATLVFRSESGGGKSRLLREAALEAQLAGLVVSGASAELAAPRAFGVIADLLTGVVAARPESARPIVRARAEALSRVLPSLASGLPPRQQPVDPSEERLRVLGAVHQVFIDLAAREPLALIVDDVQRADEASAAALAALARASDRHPILLIVAQRLGEPLRAEAAIKALESAATQTLDLAGFDEQSIAKLVESSFGSVPHAKRLAAWLSQQTGGSALYCTELLRHWVDTEVLRFADGHWILPTELDLRSLPVGLAQTVESRLARLDASTRAVGETLALAGGDLSLELCVALTSDAAQAEPTEVFDALDALSRQGALVGDGEKWRFRHDAWREALLRGLSAERKATLHLRLGEYFLDRPDLGRRDDAGWHLLEAGDDARAAPLLEDVGQRLFEAQALADCIAPLEAAWTALTRLGVKRSRTMHVEVMLLSAGWVADHRVGARFAERAMTAYSRHAGLTLAAGSSRYLGKHLALVFGVSVAFLRWMVTGFRGPNPAAAVTTFALTLGYACALANAAARLEELEKLVALSKPFGIFRRRVTYATYLATHAFPDILLGRLGDATDKLTECLDVIQNDTLSPATETQRRFAETAVRGLRALVDVNQFEPRLHEELQEIEAQGFAYYQLVANTTRVVHLRYRGEEAKARALEEELETTSLELGAWSTDVQALLFAHPAYALCNDIMGLKRCLAALEHWHREGFAFEPRIIVTRAEYQRARGRPEGGIEPLRELVETLSERDSLMQQWARSALAECLFAAARHGEARAEAEEVMRRGRSEATRVLLPWLRAHRVLALCLQQAGQSAAALELVDRAIGIAEERQIPSLAGPLHVARGRIAREQGDNLQLELARVRAREWLEPTANPALLRFLDQLSDNWSHDSGEVAELPSSTSSEITQIAMPSSRNPGSESGSQG